MSNLGLIAIMALTVFALRFSGLMAYRVELSTNLERALRFSPVAVLSALTAYALAGQASGDPARIVAAIGAGVLMLKTGRMWVCITGGFTLYWMLRLLAAML